MGDGTEGGAVGLYDRGDMCLCDRHFNESLHGVSCLWN